MKLRIQIKPEDQSKPSKSLTIEDSTSLTARNKIRFLYESLGRASGYADIRVYKDEEEKEDGKEKEKDTT